MSRNNIRVARGIRQTLPPNTILGNPYSTPGPAIVMTPAQLAGNLLNTGQVSSTASQSSGGGGSPWTSFTQGTPTTITIDSTAYTAVPLSPDIFPLVAGASTLLGARLTPGATFNKCGFALVNGSGDGYYLAIQSDSNLVLASFTASGQSIIDAGPGSHGTTTGEGYYNGNWKNSGQFDQSYQWLIEAEAASANGFWVQQGLGGFLGFSADTTYDLTSGTWGFYFFYAVGDDPVLDWAGYTTPPLGSVLSVGSVPIVLPPGTTATTQSSGDTSTKVATDAFVAAAVGANQLTGDVTAGPGAGSQVATLATVNTDVGSYTLASVTVNAKGLVTAASSGSVSVPSGANPSGTAGPSAVDGSATTFMRSDGAPAVQKASAGTQATWDPANTNAGLTLSNGNLTATSTVDGTNENTIGTVSHSTGKWHFEFQNNTIIHEGDPSFGLTSSLDSAGTYLGQNTAGVGYYGGGSGDGFYLNASPIGPSSADDEGSWCAIDIDIDGKLIWFYSSVTSRYNSSATANPATGTGGISIAGLASFTLFPAFSGYNIGDSTTLATTLASFKGTVPSGFSPWSDGGAPQLGIVNADGTTITVAAGILTAVSGAAGINQLTGDVTAGAGVGSQAATLATVNSDVGTYQGITVNGKGLVTAAVNESYLTANQSITLSGDVAGSGTTAITATLATVNSDTGTINGVTTNAKGLVTANVANGANPTGTAGPSAVNGSATTFMRSDGAPAVQKASSSQFGIVEVDNVTITASSGVISTNPGVVANYNVGTPAHQRPNSSGSYEMMGFGSNLTFTPTRTGNFLVLFNAIVNVDPTGNTLQAQSYLPCIGSGTPPSYGDAVAGNFGQGITAGITGLSADISQAYLPISFIGIKTGLTIGTTYWFDLTGIYVGTQDQCALSSLDMTVVEM